MHMYVCKKENLEKTDEKSIKGEKEEEKEEEEEKEKEKKKKKRKGKRKRGKYFARSTFFFRRS